MGTRNPREVNILFGYNDRSVDLLKLFLNQPPLFVLHEFGISALQRGGHGAPVLLNKLFVLVVIFDIILLLEIVVHGRV